MNCNCLSLDVSIKFLKYPVSVIIFDEFIIYVILAEDERLLAFSFVEIAPESIIAVWCKLASRTYSFKNYDWLTFDMIWELCSAQCSILMNSGAL